MGLADVLGKLSAQLAGGGHDSLIKSQLSAMRASESLQAMHDAQQYGNTPFAKFLSPSAQYFSRKPTQQLDLMEQQQSHDLQMAKLQSNPNFQMFNTASQGTGLMQKIGVAGRAAMGDPTAIAEGIQIAITDKIQGLQGMGTEGTALLQSQKFEDISKHLGGFAENLGKVTGMPLVEYYGKLINVIGQTVGWIRDWGDGLHKANMQFAEYSAGMAGVQARQEVRDIWLSQERGDRRAGSAEYLAQAKNRLDRGAAPFEDLFANFMNKLGGFSLTAIALVLEDIKKVVSVVPGIADWLKGDGSGDTGGFEDLKQMTGQGWEDYGAPRRFK